MYFRSSLRNNPATKQSEGYWRLVESYRNEFGRVCHRTLYNVGFISFDADKLVTIQRVLNNRLERKEPLFEENDQDAISIADKYLQEMVSKKKIDVSDQVFEKSKRLVDIDTLKHKNAREIGAEWMCYQGLEQLELKKKLEHLGWIEEDIQLVLTQIISRAVYPFSENRTTRWIKENSAICEITGYPIDKITKDKLYGSALNLYKIKDSLEKHLSTKTNELFDLQDKIYLYDLTNTYFEGRKLDSKLANFGRSKEKRSDCKLVVLALVVNVEGFIKYSNIFEGNTTDNTTLPQIIDNLRIQTSDEKRAIVVIDAGIATEDNLAILKAKGYDYVCVSRSKIKNYTISHNGAIRHLMTKDNQIITLQKVEKEKETDYLLKVKSTGKQAKECSMKSKFENRFLEELGKINASLTKKYGVKKADKVNQRIGRMIKKYPSAAKFYDIETLVEKDIVTKIIHQKKKSSELNDQELGCYFIKTNLNTENELSLWTIYNSIREIESAFRCLKNDLDLRPIYHKNDDATMAHLHLGILAYWLVNTLRYQLKQKKINHNWQEIVRITNTQKIVTTYGQNKDDEIIYVRRCTEPNKKVKQIYIALKYKNYPFTKRKSVVHKSEIKKNEHQHLKELEDS
jgi:Transposase DDE domain